MDLIDLPVVAADERVSAPPCLSDAKVRRWAQPETLQRPAMGTEFVRLERFALVAGTAIPPAVVAAAAFVTAFAPAAVDDDVIALVAFDERSDDSRLALQWHSFDGWWPYPDPATCNFPCNLPNCAPNCTMSDRADDFESTAVAVRDLISLRSFRIWHSHHHDRRVRRLDRC